jgi:hypothetical protein
MGADQHYLLSGSSPSEPVVELSFIHDHPARPRLHRRRNTSCPEKAGSGCQVARKCVRPQGQRQKAQEPPHPSLHPVFV